MNWIDAAFGHPNDRSPCVVLTRDMHGLWERQFAQFSNGQWYCMGSGEKLRDVRWYYPMPALPKPLVGS